MRIDPPVAGTVLIMRTPEQGIGHVAIELAGNAADLLDGRLDFVGVAPEQHIPRPLALGDWREFVIGVVKKDGGHLALAARRVDTASDAYHAADTVGAGA